MKLLRIMKLIAILLTTTCLQVSAYTSAQVSFSLREVGLDKVFTEIEKQTGMPVLFNWPDLAGTKKVTLQFTNATYQQVLSKALEGQPLAYEVKNGGIVVYRRKEGNPRPPTPIPSDTTKIEVRAKVVDSAGAPLKGAAVRVKNSPIGTSTDDAGYFTLEAPENAKIVVSFVGFQPMELSAKSINKVSTVRLFINQISLAEVNVTYSTGYQKVQPEKATGSYSHISNELINRRISTDILSRIENLTPGVSFNNPIDGVLIRGRNSIFSNVSPLIVLDNFPYDGDINNINPNDIESITILKDAAAASIWGARSGNGVIVITTKKGKSGKPQVQITSNISLQERPDLFSLPIISSADAIDLEKYLFENGYYDASIANTTTRPPLTPVQELLLKKRDGLITETEYNKLIEPLKAIDARSDLKKYFYQTGINRQNSLNISGNSSNINYYMSVGWDKNTTNLVSNGFERITLRTQNTFKVSNNLQISAGVVYAQTSSERGNNPGIGVNSGAGKGLYPYADLVDANGNPLKMVKNFRSGYIDTLGGGKLLNWEYYPLSDISERENKISNKEYLITAGLKYNLLESLSLELSYQFSSNVQISRDHYSEKSFFTRDLINKYSNIASSSGEIVRPIPVGGIMDILNSEGRSNQGRAQVNFSKKFSSKHDIAAIAGWEIKDFVTTGNSQRIYGFRPDKNIVADKINYDVYYPMYNDPSKSAQIPQLLSISKTSDRFISYYVNTSYTFAERYTLSASAREDAANLFGVKTNQRGTPLWSLGASWLISKEKFFALSWLDQLRAKITYGANGNISRKTSAYTTATFGTALSIPNLLSATIINPPNEELRWEQVKTLNLGVDFQSKNNRLSGSVEFYFKKATDLMGQAPIDPTYGFGSSGGQSFFYGNVANMKGDGYDIELHSRNIVSPFSWNTHIGFSRAYMEISKYLMPQNSIGSSYLGSGAVNPIVGKPVFVAYAYPWNGLDPNTGDPLGRLNGHSTTDYNSISRLPLDSLHYSGPLQPVYYGFIRNDFSWKQFSLSFTISYKGGYVFRKQSIIYGSLFNNWTGHSDYAKRWKKPGDETTTYVPSLIYNPTGQGLRDAFYANSEVLIESGDHIRFEDIQLNYILQGHKKRKVPFQQLKVYSYINNLGLIWKANKAGIDPYFQDVPKQGLMLSFGISAIF